MDSKSQNKVSRREIIKKAAKTGAFVLPTMTTFEVKDLKAEVSGINRFPNEPQKPALGR